MGLRLIVIRDGAKRIVEIEGDRVLVGRGAACDLVLADPGISREHFRIERRGEAWRVLDLGSHNGTLVNGAAVSVRDLHPGDRIEAGGTSVWFETEAAAAGAGKAAEDAESPRADAAAGTGLSLEAGARESGEGAGGKGEDRERSLRLLRINEALNSELDPDRILAVVLDSAIELTGAERGFLLLETEGDLTVRLARNAEGGSVEDPEAAWSRNLARQVLSSGEARTALDARSEDPWRQFRSVAELGLRSVLCGPLRSRGRAAGVIYLDNRLQRGAFTPADVTLLEAFANQAALALERARMAEELLETRRALREAESRVERLRSRTGDRAASPQPARSAASGNDYAGIVAVSAPMREVLRLVDRVIESDFPVLLEGESGTGKELLARAIHRNGKRRGEAFVVENCAALPDNLLESELFGYVRGAFTGALRDKPGLLEASHGGTLFLDEISEMSADVQRKILRVLQEGEFRPVGASRTVRVNFRLLTASNRDLARCVREGTFREDLFFRVNVLRVRIPPLRERPDDIPPLLDHILGELAVSEGLAPRRVDPAALRCLVRYPWPGNVRELENEVRRALTLSEGTITPDDLSTTVREGRPVIEIRPLGGEAPKDPGPSPSPGASGPPPPGETASGRLERMERQEIQRALAESGGNKTRAAEILGVSRFTLQRRLRKHGLLAEGGEDPGTTRAPSPAGEPPEPRP